ncbi:MAG: hypothetical protein H6822_21855 [Planctomycetaceae bacterium]|nr:hypothetical protein [Planctomycetales bacterium]MCB9924841.1 hypothetical protein [Planctomycetaceae bacterium]
MRSYGVSCALAGLLLCHSAGALGADDSEPVNPFEQPSPSNRAVTASFSDETDVEEERGFSLPRLSLPKLPTPTLPKPSMPSFSLPKLQMPKLSMPEWTKRDSTPNTGPSTWQKLNNGTKSMLSKTRDTLMPWTVDDDASAVRHATGSRSSTGISRTRVSSNRGNASSSTGEKKSFFSSILPSSEPEPAPVRTTSDFLSQKRPLFD